ncbi:riboflavin synthase [Pelotalea chapellei]|uniref:Riboflavin synthase n=1 Tax=Pelotalea chapellei TaxID=44671 RepID=A0ABS5U7Z2_9BACT|nr:riboflavin synthase [Pelotalea chapellei]MBT1071785.1 riboflavin synthase [Pelotalea chapellei]
MFTGLIEDIGRISAFERRAGAGILRVETTLPLAEIALGDSVAVNGACLTVTGKTSSILTFDVSPESLAGTTLGTLGSGSRVNLERALRLGDRMGGHIVTGHIDCIGQLSRLQTVSGNRILEFSLPASSLRYLVTKGSVAIDGISLTVNTVSTESFSVNIIPHTFSCTTLATVTTGQSVNIETDIIGKYVEQLVQPWKSGGGLSIQTLAENGFL